MFKETSHLAIFSPELIAKVLQGQQRLDIRLSQRAIPPYQAIKRGDKILIKKPGGKIYGQAKVSNVLFYNNLNPRKVIKLRVRYARKLMIDPSFWKRKEIAKFATVIFFNSVKRYLAPISYKKSDRRAWVVISD